MLTIPDTATTVVRASHVPGPRQGQWTYEDYARLPEVEGFRYEIIDGVLYMTPAPNTGHERIVMTLGARLVQALEDTGLGRVFASPDIAVGPVTLRPDAVVVLEANRGIIVDKKLGGPPDLVVEIASPSTAAYDRDPVDGKRGAYARMGVPEYWIVDPEARSVEVLALEPAADQAGAVAAYTPLGVFAGDERLISRALPGLAVTARQLFPRE